MVDIVGKIGIEKRTVPDYKCGIRFHKEYRFCRNRVIQFFGVFVIITTDADYFHIWIKLLLSESP